MLKNIFKFAALFILALELISDDWPMWRRDPARTGTGPEEISDSLSLL